MIHLAKTKYGKYWVLSDTHGAAASTDTVRKAIASWHITRFDLTAGNNNYTIKGNTIYDRGTIYGTILVSAKGILNLNVTNYPEYFI